jgi:hypothetical protein
MLLASLAYWLYTARWTPKIREEEMINEKPESQPTGTHQPATHPFPEISQGQIVQQLQPRVAIVDPGSYCPNCGSKMRESRCKLSCKTCGFFLSCSDFY